MLAKSNTPNYELTSSSKRIEDRDARGEALTANFTTVQPSKHPIDLSSRNRNLSLNDLRPSPAKNEVRSSMLRESIREDSSEHAGKELRKLRARVDDLERENKSLYNLSIEYEQEMKVWQEKARQLNEELIHYENRELQARPQIHHQLQIREEMRQSEEVKDLKYGIVLLQEQNNQNLKKISELAAQLDKTRREGARSNELQTIFRHLQLDYQDMQQRFEREVLKNKQSLTQIERLEQELDYISRELPRRISLIESETGRKEHQKQQFEEELKLSEKQVQQLKLKLLDASEQREKIQQLNTSLKIQISSLSQSKTKFHAEVERLTEESLKLKQANYQQQSQLEQELFKKERQLSSERAELMSQNTMLSKQSHRLQAMLDQKTLTIQQLEQRLRNLNEELSLNKAAKIEIERSFVKSEILKDVQQESSSYKREIEKLTKLNEVLSKEIKEVESFYLHERSQLKEEAQRRIEAMQIQIETLQRNHQNEKMQLVESVDIDITDLGNIAKEQENQIANLHRSYCQEIDKLVAENNLLRTNISQVQAHFFDQRQALENKVKEYKEYAYTADVLTIQVEKLTQELEESRFTITQNARKLAVSELQLEEASKNVNELSIKTRDLHMEIEQLSQENEKWRSYRRSEEEDARKECRRYKKRVEELELKQHSEANVLTELEVFQKSCEQLKVEMIEQEKVHNRILQEQKQRLAQAIDEMQEEMRKILKECDDKLIQKQAQIHDLRSELMQQTHQLTELASRERQVKLINESSYSSQIEVQLENNLLKKDLATSKNELVKVQTLLKRQEADNQALKLAADSQKDTIRSRYDKDMEEKVTEIQRLKLEVAQLTEELKKNLISKKGLEGLQISLKNKEMEERESSQRNRYLESMIETYMGEIKSLKAMKDKDSSERKSLEDLITNLERRIAQKEAEFNAESTRLGRINDETARQCQRDLREWREKYESSSTEIRKLQVKLTETSLQAKDLNKIVREQQSKIGQLQKELTYESSKLARVSDEKSREYQYEIREWKEKYDSALLDIRKVESRLTDANLKEKQLVKAARDQEAKIDGLNEAISQANRSKAQIDDLKQKCQFLEERLNMSTGQNSQMEDLRSKCTGLEERQASYQGVIEDQKKMIQTLSKDQQEKFHEIEILLSKISMLEADLKAKSKPRKPAQVEVQVDNGKAQRVEWYSKMCSLSLVGNPACKLQFDGDEELFLKILYDSLRILSKRLNECLNQIGEKKKTILELSADRQNLHNKYLKYKSIAMEYKDKKEMQRFVLKNTYRFNEEILSHCQNIIQK